MFGLFKKRKKKKESEFKAPKLPELNSISECIKCGAKFDPCDEANVPMRYYTRMKTESYGVDPMIVINVFDYDSIARTCPRCGYEWHEKPICQRVCND